MLPEFHLRRPLQHWQREAGLQDDVQEAPLQRPALPPNPDLGARPHGRHAQGTSAHRTAVLEVSYKGCKSRARARASLSFRRVWALEPLVPSPKSPRF